MTFVISEFAGPLQICPQEQPPPGCGRRLEALQAAAVLLLPVDDEQA